MIIEWSNVASYVKLFQIANGSWLVRAFAYRSTHTRNRSTNNIVGILRCSYLLAVALDVDVQCSVSYRTAI